VLSVLWNDQGAAGASAVGVYGAVLRVGQALFLFLTSVSLTFSPFVADLHHRGERERLDALYKNVTRWTLAATIPMLLVLAILPRETLRIFGADFTAGADALRILIVGMIVPVTVGTVGFILIMAGRTGWDLLVYVGAFAIDIGVALAFAGPGRLGIRGAALAQALTLSCSAVARLLLVRRFLGIWPFDRGWLRLVAPTVLGGLTMGLVHTAMPDGRWFVDLVVSAGAGVGVYGAALLATGVLPAERAALARLVLRRPASGPSDRSLEEDLRAER
jgi:O-antigen/teichoic acid export membrane protein